MLVTRRRCFRSRPARGSASRQQARSAGAGSPATRATARASSTSGNQPATRLGTPNPDSPLSMWSRRPRRPWPGSAGHQHGNEAQGANAMNQPDVLAQLTEAGVAVWLDDISRERLATGNLEKLMRDMHVRGVTSNPTIFANALAHGEAYDDQVADLALRGVSVGEASRA